MLNRRTLIIGSLASAAALPKIVRALDASDIVHQITRSRKAELPEGVFLIDQRANRAAAIAVSGGRVSIRGAGAGRTVLRLAAGSDRNFLSLRGLEQVELEGLTLDCQKEYQSAGSGITVSECQKVNCFDIEVINPFGNGFLFNGSNRDVTIRKWRVTGARSSTGRHNPSSGHGIALSASADGHLTGFRITEGAVTDCDGSGVNVSHAQDGEVRSLHVQHKGKHETGYAGIRFTNSARKVTAEDVTVRGLTRALMISSCQDITVRNLSGTSLGGEGVLLRGKSGDTTGLRLEGIRIDNPGRMARPGSTTGVLFYDVSDSTLEDSVIRDTLGNMEWGVEERGECRGNTIRRVRVTGARGADFKLQSAQSTR